MQYVANHGMWSDLPFERIRDDFTAYYGAEIWERCRAETARNESRQARNFEDERPVA